MTPAATRRIVRLTGGAHSGRQDQLVREIGQLIRRTRRTQGLRQDQLAGAAGVGVRFLVELERGKPTAQLDKALAVLEALGCSIQIEPPSESE